MRELFRENPVRTIFTVAYLAFAFLYLVYGFLPAEAENEPVSGHLAIPAAAIYSDVTPSYIEDHELYVPDEIVSAYHSGSHKAFLMGHSITVFQNLPAVELGDTIFYDAKIYRVTRKTEIPVEDIDMAEIVKDIESDTLILMTCAGEEINGQYNRRLIVEAQ